MQLNNLALALLLFSVGFPGCAAYYRRNPYYNRWNNHTNRRFGYDPMFQGLYGGHNIHHGVNRQLQDHFHRRHYVRQPLHQDHYNQHRPDRLAQDSQQVHNQHSVGESRMQKRFLETAGLSEKEMSVEPLQKRPVPIGENMTIHREGELSNSNPTTTESFEKKPQKNTVPRGEDEAMRMALERLKLGLNHIQVSEKEILEDLDLLQGIVLRMDFGRDFGKLGGMEVLMELLGIGSAAVKAQSSLGKNVIQDLMATLRTSRDPKVISGVLTGLSSVIRGPPEARSIFKMYGGGDLLLRLATYEDERVKRKVLGLVADLVSFPNGAQLFSTNKWCALMAGYISDAELDLQERALRYYAGETNCEDGDCVLGVGPVCRSAYAEWALTKLEEEHRDSIDLFDRDLATLANQGLQRMRR